MLEERRLLAGDTFLINFQNDEATTPIHYLRDTGLVFGVRGGGLSYGWTSDHTDVSRERSLLADQRLDTLIHFHAGQAWEFALASGVYDVTVAVGDPGADDGVHTINVEGVNYWSAVPDGVLYRSMTKTITVTDGRLSIDQGAAADKATRIQYVHIVGVSGPGNAAPSTPTVTEPATDGQFTNPADVHMEVVGYADPNGDAHKSTDWEIWTTGPNPEVVWQTLGIQGVERLHTHLGDGIFVNNRAGQIDLAANTNYQLRVRFRDDAGSVSGYGTRLFSTGSASTIFPMQIEDIADGAPLHWTTISGSAVDLPGAGAPASLRVESGATGSGFVQIIGAATPGNTVTNFAPLGVHSDVRIVITAGSTSLFLAESDLTFRTDDGQDLTAYLPAIALAPGQGVVLWVASSGATYYGAAGQTTPNFTSLARQANLTVPYIVNKPGFVIEAVGTGYRLPVNIAFVPDPGPNPDDPLYFVTELYGSIQVVTRDGTKHEFATGLLDYNPQGPISGSGEQGLTGIAVRRDPTNPEVYQLFVGMLADNGSPAGGATHYPKVERLTSVAGGLSMASRTVLLNMQPETQGQSHQISNISIGPDGKLYVHNGDGFNTATALNLDQFRGKVLRMNLDGTAPSDNPFYNAANGITARDYVYAYGLRNPFGGAWRAADGQHYEVENGPSVDRFAKVVRGGSLGWNGSDASMQIGAIYNWSPASAPVNLTFVQPETFAGSQFPADMQDHAFVSESGATYAGGPQASGKKISEFVLSGSGTLLGGPAALVQYVGAGRSTVVGLAAGPDGLYFTSLYEDSGAGGPAGAGAVVYRVRYINPLVGDYNIDGVVDQNDYTVWSQSYGSNLLLAADGNGDGRVDAADYTVWRDAFASFASMSSPANSEAVNPAIDALSAAPPREVLAHGSLANSRDIVLGMLYSDGATAAPNVRSTFRPSLRLAGGDNMRNLALLLSSVSGAADAPLRNATSEDSWFSQETGEEREEAAGDLTEMEGMAWSDL